MDLNMYNAITVEQACKAYGNKIVLDNFCMKVKKGSIYGLLGPSGCGKTVLLSCIVGLKNLDDGEIFINLPSFKENSEEHEIFQDISVSRVGYMPQDIALVGECTVRGIIFYFGRIVNMTDKLIEERYRELEKLLNLPPGGRLVKDCSGGEQRRISFAAALIHEPDLLILDEPTVGLDPLLRERIWDHLIKLTTTRHTTVIITTHYIEEAKQANTIGLMRNGKLLIEKSPEELLHQFNSQNFEDIFFQLCKMEKDLKTSPTSSFHDEHLEMVEIPLNTSQNQLITSTKSTNLLKSNDCQNCLSLRRTNALLIKNWRQFTGNTIGVLWVLGFPLLSLLSIFIAIGPTVQDIKVGIVNDENIYNLCNNYNISQTVIPTTDETDCGFTALSCRFIDELEDPMIDKIPMMELNQAKNEVVLGKLAGVIYIAQNFTNAFEERHNNIRDVEDLHTSEIQVYLDMSNSQIGGVLKMKLYKKYFEFQRGLMSDCGYNEKVSDLPMRLENPIYGQEEEDYTIFIVPGILLSLVFFMGTTMTATIILSDRMEGVWERSIVCGVTSAEILLGHFITQSILLIIQIGEMLVLTFLIYKIQFAGNMMILIILSILLGVCGMSFGFLISIVVDNHNMAHIASTGSIFPLCVLCGMIWPLEAQPIILQWFSKLLPCTLPILSFRNVMVKGWSIGNFDVYIGIIVEIIWLVLFVCFDLYVLRRKR